MNTRVPPDIAARFAARSKAVVAMLRAVPKPLVAGFPVSIDEVLDTIASIDRRKAVAAFAKELEVDDFGDAKAIHYEWYYDGSDAATWADGYGYTQCKQPYKYSDTDLIDGLRKKNLGVESGVDLGDTNGDEIGGIEIGRVLIAQHDVCEQVDEHYLHVEAETLVPTMTQEQRFALPGLSDCYRNLFDLRLYEILYEACRKVTARPEWVFVGSHERWPILVGTPPSTSAPKAKAKRARAKVKPKQPKSKRR